MWGTDRSASNAAQTQQYRGRTLTGAMLASSASPLYSCGLGCLMRKFRIERNSQKYQAILAVHQTTGAPMDDAALGKTPNDATILTGNKTINLGGGPSPYGFVMSGGRVIGYVNLERRGLMNKDVLTTASKAQGR